ncbi:uncharacterized protein [Anabrus simplex]|uniref:uncharacterized protein n=1 Tax=Anabrus simplex TaxID=316456 RepID=UPI0035A3A0D9
MESLPNEILEKIFSYCTHKDLVQSIQNVCSWWREVAQSASVWQHFEYCPKHNTSSEQIVEMLKLSPKLQNMVLKNKYDDRILQAITENCAELRKLEIESPADIDLKFIENLQGKCPKVEFLRIPHQFLTDCGDVGKFTNLKVLLLTGSQMKNLEINLEPLANNCKKLERLEFLSTNFKMNDLRYLLSMRQDTLRTLGISCCNMFGECVLPALSTCDLRSLSLFFYGACERHYNKIDNFERLKTVRVLTIRNFYDDDSDRVKQYADVAQLMELRLYGYHFEDDIIKIIVKKCPVLNHLALISSMKITDASLMIIRKCKELCSLNIFCNNCVSDTGIIHLHHVQSLKYLRIAWCSNLTKQGYVNILKLSSLRALNLELQDLAEFPWDLIPIQMNNLRHLGIYRCNNVDRSAVEELKRRFTGLSVDIWWCRVRAA